MKVDGRGDPYRIAAKFLTNDVKSFANNLNLAYGWSDQPMVDKMRFIECMATCITWYCSCCNGF